MLDLSRLIRNKKGALELSVNSIVIMVIAFVVLGLILTFTRTIFNFGTDRVGGIMDIGALDTPPDAQNPISIPDTISIKKNGREERNVGYYNRGSDTAQSATFKFSTCTHSGGDVDANLIPSITAVSQDVDASSAKGYKIIINENGLTSGETYICTLDVIKSDGTDEEVYESKQIFVRIVA